MTQRDVFSKSAWMFQRARRKAQLRALWSHLQHRSNTLLAYDDVREKLRIGGPVYRGIQTVPIDKVVGSVSRFRDFDRAYLPKQDFTKNRWQSIGRAFISEVYLPPVHLYQVGDVYFVVDGNHRISVARELGQQFIDAEVQECRTRVQLDSNIRAEDLEVIGERVRFLSETHLDETRPEANLEATIPGGYDLLLEHINVHQFLQSSEWQREFSTEEAAAQWYDQVYLPTIKLIRETDILADFPQRNETDLYLWLMDHLYYLRERFGEGINPQSAARGFAEAYANRPLKRLWRRVKRTVSGSVARQQLH